MKSLILMTTLVSLSACDDSSDRASHPEGLGRYRHISGTNGYPPLLLDSATGCLQQIVLQGEGRDADVSKRPVDFGALGKDRACADSGIVADPKGNQQ